MVDATRHVIPDPEIHSLVSRWRARAQELLAQADAMQDADARLTMQEIAAKYEVLAQRVELHIGRGGEAQFNSALRDEPDARFGRQFFFAVGTMPDLTLLEMARDLRARADEVSVRAESFRDADARQKLQKIAETYVKLAERLEGASEQATLQWAAAEKVTKWRNPRGNLSAMSATLLAVPQLEPMTENELRVLARRFRVRAAEVMSCRWPR